MERHLADMREWYRHKLRDLAAGRPIDDADMPAWEPIAVGATPPPRPMLAVHTLPVEADAADRQLGDVLKTRGLVDDAALDALQDRSEPSAEVAAADAAGQRRRHASINSH